MATETEWRCPICHDPRDDVSYVTHCLHQFCLGCIVRWTKRRSSCPLCRQTVETIIYSLRSEEDFLEIFLGQPPDPSVASHQGEQEASGLSPRNYVAVFQPEVWAALFRDCVEVIEPLLPWLYRELSGLYGARWWDVALVQGNILLNLCHYGLDEASLVQELQPFLQHQTVTFVHRLIAVATDLCGRAFLQQLGFPHSQTAEEQEDSPMTPPGPAISLEGNPVPSHRAQEEPNEELGQVVTDCSSTGQGKDSSPDRP